MGWGMGPTMMGPIMSKMFIGRLLVESKKMGGVGPSSASGSEPRLLARQMPKAFPQGGLIPPEEVK